MVRKISQCLLVLVLADIAAAFVFNNTLDEDDDFMGLRNRRQGRGRNVMEIPKKGGGESTSSDGKRRDTASGSGGSSESLKQSFTDETSTDSDQKGRVAKDRIPKSSAERKGWRKWHRKCTPCPEDMNMKWRDPGIKWICGAYQRARRSFKSSCMMYFRNCQDGTMFTKIADHRCPNPSAVRPYGDHFFYDYSVVLSDDDTVTEDSEESTVEISSSSSWDSSRIRKLPPLKRQN